MGQKIIVRKDDSGGDRWNTLMTYPSAAAQLFVVRAEGIPFVVLMDDG